MWRMIGGVCRDGGPGCGGRGPKSEAGGADEKLKRKDSRSDEISVDELRRDGNKKSTYG